MIGGVALDLLLGGFLAGLGAGLGLVVGIAVLDTGKLTGGMEPENGNGLGYGGLLRLVLMRGCREKAAVWEDEGDVEDAVVEVDGEAEDTVESVGTNDVVVENVGEEDGVVVHTDVAGGGGGISCIRGPGTAVGCVE